MNKKHDTFLIQIFIEWRRKILQTLLLIITIQCILNKQHILLILLWLKCNLIIYLLC